MKTMEIGKTSLSKLDHSQFGEYNRSPNPCGTGIRASDWGSLESIGSASLAGLVDRLEHQMPRQSFPVDDPTTDRF